VDAATGAVKNHDAAPMPGHECHERTSRLGARGCKTSSNLMIFLGAPVVFASA
jgi:hypothetical protein